MPLTKHLKTYLKNWTFPFVLFGACAVLMVLTGFDTSSGYYFQITAAVLLGIGGLVLLISAVYQFWTKRWINGVLTLIALFGGTFITAVLFFLLVSAITMIDGDHWADDLKIPDGIQIDNPVEMDSYKRPDSIVNLIKEEPDLILYNSSQPGIYEYDFWMGKIEEGTIYLKAFEITQEKQLSKVSVKNESQIVIENTTDDIQRFSSLESFSIYEGDWGQYYTARFEVWFIPASGGPERKLYQKNFKIEGWMH